MHTGGRGRDRQTHRTVVKVLAAVISDNYTSLTVFKSRFDWICHFGLAGCPDFITPAVSAINASLMEIRFGMHRMAQKISVKSVFEDKPFVKS